VEERVDKLGAHDEEGRQLLLEHAVVVLVLGRRRLVVLLDLEQVLLVRERLFLLVAELVKRVVVPVVVDELQRGGCGSATGGSG
jgi:hypothetical protein